MINAKMNMNDMRRIMWYNMYNDWCNDEYNIDCMNECENKWIIWQQSVYEYVNDWMIV